jgi:hypothetical protein
VHLNTQAKGIADRAEQTSATCFGAETWGTYANQNPIMHQLWQQNLQGQTQGTMHHMQRQILPNNPAAASTVTTRTTEFAGMAAKPSNAT